MFGLELSSVDIVASLSKECAEFADLAANLSQTLAETLRTLGRLKTTVIDDVDDQSEYADEVANVYNEVTKSFRERAVDLSSIHRASSEAAVNLTSAMLNKVASLERALGGDIDLLPHQLRDALNLYADKTE
jgi:methionine synthase II (cobalamin-independent)